MLLRSVGCSVVGMLVIPLFPWGSILDPGVLFLASISNSHTANFEQESGKMQQIMFRVTTRGGEKASREVGLYLISAVPGYNVPRGLVI